MADNSLAFGGGAFASAPPVQTSRARPSARPALAAVQTLTLRRLTPGIVLTAAVAALTFWIGYDGGTYSLTSRTTLGIGVTWAALVGVLTGILPAGRSWRPALVPAGFLAAFGLWTVLSTGWAVSAERAFAEFDRVGLLLAVFVLAALAASRASAPRIADGVAVGIAAVAVVALAARLFPGLASQAALKTYLPVAYVRLSYPVNYWNGLGVLLALGFPLLLRIAVAARSPFVRGAALAPLPALFAAIYLTSSRGGMIAGAVACLVFFAFANERWAVVEAIVLAGVGSLVAVFALHVRGGVVNPPLHGTVPGAAGHIAATLVGVTCLAVGALYVLRLIALPPLPLPRWVGRAALVAAAVLAILGLALSHPVAHFEAFKRPPDLRRPAGPDYVQTHLFSTNGSGRWQFWGAALREFEGRPLGGRGAGSFEAWWARHGTLPVFVRDAHSLYLQTLGELGIVGFLLLAGALGFALAIALVGLARAEPEERTTRGALLAVAAGFLLAAGIDWMWQLTAVSAVGVACLGLGAGLGAGPEPRRRGSRIGLAAAVLVFGLALMAGQGIALVAQTRLSASQAAVNRRDTKAALQAALGARNVEPWAATPYLQLALVGEQSGALGQAERRIRQAITRDRTDWRLWLTQARIQTKRGEIAAARRSLARARELNPRSPLFKSP